MKIGLINFCYGHNYGAVLQCLALSRVLTSKGHDVSVIDYRPATATPQAFWQGWGLRSDPSLTKARVRWIELLHGASVRRGFSRFKASTMRFTEACTTVADVERVAAGFDAVVVGSDQVWNECFFERPVYFLGFPFRGKRIAYAACCGHAPTAAAQGSLESVRSWLRAFDSISVRNEVTCQFVTRCIGNTCDVVADPTLLCDYSSDIKAPAWRSDKGYIISYVLGKEIHGGNSAAISLIRRQLGDLPTVAVSSAAHLPDLSPWADRRIYDADPGEWLGWFASAEFVYTNSFHGLLFALILQKPFLAYYSEEERADRLIDVATRYKVDKFLVKSVADVADLAAGVGTAPDYRQVSAAIRAHATHSLAFLKQALE